MHEGMQTLKALGVEFFGEYCKQVLQRQNTLIHIRGSSSTLLAMEWKVLCTQKTTVYHSAILCNLSSVFLRSLKCLYLIVAVALQISSLRLHLRTPWSFTQRSLDMTFMPVLM